MRRVATAQPFNLSIFRLSITSTVFIIAKSLSKCFADIPCLIFHRNVLLFITISYLYLAVSLHTNCRILIFVVHIFIWYFLFYTQQFDTSYYFEIQPFSISTILKCISVLFQQERYYSIIPIPVCKNRALIHCFSPLFR